MIAFSGSKTCCVALNLIAVHFDLSGNAFRQHLEKQTVLKIEKLTSNECFIRQLFINPIDSEYNNMSGRVESNH